MIKVQGVMAESFMHAGPARKPPVNNESQPQPSDLVTISDEGKKKRIMGHVMATLAAPGTGKV